MTGVKIAATPEGREGVYVPDRESLKAWIRAQEFASIHNFCGSTGAPVVVGANHSVESVIANIDLALRLGLLIGEVRRNNFNHALALIMPDSSGERLEMYDIGEVTDADIEAS